MRRMGEAAPSRSWRQRVGGAVTDRRLVAYVLMPLLLACAFTLLIALNVLLRNLWGELVYAILVTGIALWALSQTTLVNGLFLRLGVRPFTIRRAILWATFVLVALPVAGDRGWPGLLILLDRREARFPLDIEDAARAGRISSCSGDECRGVRRAAALDRSANFVEIADFTGERGGGPGSAYYYHVVDKDRPNRIYVDYWWYFTRNPSPIGAAVGCAPGARWVGVTCHDHPSDWEGVTVVLGPCLDASRDCVRSGEERYGPLAVRYAQHEHLVSYSWPTLSELWRSAQHREPARPLVFVARDSHASYPAPCSGGCKQYANYPVFSADLPFVDEKRDESPHDGKLAWNYNDSCSQAEDGDTATDCLEPMPITADGLAASWNAFRGRWGRQTCILAGAYCDTSRAPGSPSGQGRYRDPGRRGPWLCLADRQPVLNECGEADPDEEIPTQRGSV